MPDTAANPNSLSRRIESIDILRGIVMVIMALDHTREFFHIAANTDDPLNLATTTPILYATRWITHFCAPAFVFLSGLSAYLQGLRKTKKELSTFLLKRGVWLIVVEMVIISFGWSFNPSYNYVFFQVIWAIGISMIILGLMIRLHFNIVLGAGLLIVFGHNLLDIYESAPGFMPGFWSDLLHSARFTKHEILPGHSVYIVYPFIPWAGLMMLGYCAGVWFSPSTEEAQRKKYLIVTGLSLITLFIVLRFLNVYGDPEPWEGQDDPMRGFFSFMNVNKYPPSLLYLCITIGPALLFLAYSENIRNAFTRAIGIFGRVAFFYYVLHIYFLHTLTAIVFFMRGHSFNEAMVTGEHFPFYFMTVGEGFQLPGVYAVWIGVVLLLFPLCKRYDKFKTGNKTKWWLSYL